MLPSQTLLHGRYLILIRVAQGGMGAVYKAADTRRSGQIWAVKEMSQAGMKPEERAEAISSFRREAETLGKLKHVNLPAVEESFEENGRQYMIMEYIEGQTLEDCLNDRSGGPIPERDVLEWASQLCDVLDHLHNQPKPIIYRDLKPQNVMIETTSGRLKLIDFGIVRFYQAAKSKDTTAMGTPGYAPPEQFGKAQTDVRSDVYALAAMLHHLLTGRDPTNKALFDFPPARQINPLISSKVEAALIQALQIRRDQRPNDISEFRRLLGIPAGKLKPAAKPKPISPSVKPQPFSPASTGLASTRKLDFGTVSQGQHPTRKLQVQSPMVMGKVAPMQAWLQVSPNNLKGSRNEIEVTVDTSQLTLGRSTWTTPNWAGDFWLRMDPYVRRFWWVLLIGLFIGFFIPFISLLVIAPFAVLAMLALIQGLIWLTFLHASRLVQTPCQHAGQVELQTGAGTETVDVAIEVTPDPVENRWRWIASGGLVCAELAAIVIILSSLV